MAAKIKDIGFLQKHIYVYARIYVIKHLPILPSFSSSGCTSLCLILSVLTLFSLPHL